VERFFGFDSSRTGLIRLRVVVLGHLFPLIPVWFQGSHCFHKLSFPSRNIREEYLQFCAKSGKGFKDSYPPPSTGGGLLNFFQRNPLDHRLRPAPRRKTLFGAGPNRESAGGPHFSLESATLLFFFAPPPCCSKEVLYFRTVEGSKKNVVRIAPNIRFRCG